MKSNACLFVRINVSNERITILVTCVYMSNYASTELNKLC